MIFLFYTYLFSIGSFSIQLTFQVSDAFKIWAQDPVRPIGQGVLLEKMGMYYFVGDTVTGDFKRLTGFVTKSRESLPLMKAVTNDQSVQGLSFVLNDSTIIIPFFIDREQEKLLFTRWRKNGKDLWTYLGPIEPVMESKYAYHWITGQHRTEESFYLIGESRFGEGGDIGHGVWLSLYDSQNHSLKIVDRFQAKYVEGEEVPVMIEWKIEEPVLKVFLHKEGDDLAELIRVIQL